MIIINFNLYSFILLKSFSVFIFKLNFLTSVNNLQLKNVLLHMEVKTSSHRWRFVLVPISWRRTLTSCWLRSLWAWSLFLISLDSWSMQPNAVLHCMFETISTLHHPISVYLINSVLNINHIRIVHLHLNQVSY